MPSPSPSAQRQAAGAAQRPLVLIVDDDERNRKLARDVLRAAEFETLEAGDGAEGIALAREHLPAVVLMDLRLPDMDGTAAVRTLKADTLTAHIPVVALSALPMADDPGRLAGAGFSGCLDKPIDVRAFPEQVRAYCTDGTA